MLCLTIPLLCMGESDDIRGSASEPSQISTPKITVLGKRPEANPEEETELNATSIPIQVRGAQTLGETLSKSPSIDVRESGGEGSIPSLFIRGQDPKQARFFLEGFPLTDAEFNQGNINLVPIGALAQADIYPEGSPVVLGEDGLGGAVNFTFVPLKESQNTVSLRGGSYEYANASANVALASIPMTINVDYTQSMENYIYYDDNGTPFNPSDDQLLTRSGNQFRRLLILPRTDFSLSPGHEISAFSLNAMTLTDIPGPVPAPTNGSLSQFFQLNGIKYKGALSKQAEIRATLYSRLDLESLRASPGDNTINSSDSSGLSVGGKIRADVRPSSILELESLAGLTWENYQIQVPGLTSGSSGSSRTEVPLGASGKINVSSWGTIKPALLAHYYLYQSETPGPTYLLFSPRIGFSATPVSFLEMHLTGGNYYRAPTMYELYGSPMGVNPNSSLTYETAVQSDVGAVIKLSKPLSWVRSIRFSYDFFVSRGHNLIAFIQNSPETQVATNIGESWITGHELALETRLPLNLRLQTGASFLYSVNLSDVSYEIGKQLPDRPPYRLQGGLSYETQRMGLGYNLSVYGPLYWDVANLKQMSPFTEHGAYVFWNTKTFGTFTLEAKNLTDVITAYSSYGNGIGSESILDNTTAYYGYPAPGRRFYLTWNYEL
jgi:vitamin B12 transporter